MIREFEKKIFKKIDFCDKQLTLRNKFTKKVEISTISKKEFLTIFKELGYKFTYKNGGYYYCESILFKEYKFLMYFHISRNIPLAYLIIYKNDIIQETGITQFGSVLRYLPYNENLVNKDFGINSQEEMKEYLKGLISLFNEFVDEYIKEIETGNIPD